MAIIGTTTTESISRTSTAPSGAPYFVYACAKAPIGVGVGGVNDWLLPPGSSVAWTEGRYRATVPPLPPGRHLRVVRRWFRPTTYAFVSDRGRVYPLHVDPEVPFVCQ